MMAVFTVLASGPTANTATGLGMQRTAFWDGTNLWVFLFTSTNVLTPYSSSDLSTFTARTAQTLAQVHNSEGRNKDVQGKVISGTPVAHVAYGYRGSNTNHRHYHTRAKFSGTTPTWDANTQVGSTLTASFSTTLEGGGTGIDSNNKIYEAYCWSTSAAFDNGGAVWPNADAGASGWTPGSASETYLDSNTNVSELHALFSLGSGNMLLIADNASTTGSPNNLLSFLWNGTSWSGSSNVFGTTLSNNINNYGATIDSTGKVHCVRRTSTGAEHRIYSGGSWAAGASIPSQAILATSGGLAMTYDNSGNVYLGILDASPGTVKYIKYNGTAWDGSWSTLESSSATRAYLSAVPGVVNGNIVWLWTEGTASPFAVKGEALSISSGTTLSAVLDGTGTLAATLTVEHALSATAAGVGELVPVLTVAHPLSTIFAGQGELAAALSVDRALVASLDGTGDVPAALSVEKALQATLAVQGDLAAALTVAHALQAALDAQGDLSASLTIAHALTAVLDGQGDLNASLTVGAQGLSAILAASGDLLASLTVEHALSAVLAGQGDLAAVLTVAHALSATLDGVGELLGTLTVISAGPLITPVGTLVADTLPAGSLAANTTPAGALAAGRVPGGTITAGSTPGGTLAADTVPAGTLEEE